MTLLNENCLCPEGVTPDPCVPAEDVAVDFEPTSIKDYEVRDPCNPCEEKIAPCAPAVLLYPSRPVCQKVDPAYDPRKLQKGSGSYNLYIPITPSESPVIKKVMRFCDQRPCAHIDNTEYEVGDRIYTWKAIGAVAEKPLEFYVAQEYEHCVGERAGYVHVGVQNSCNEWVPIDEVQDYHMMTPTQIFIGSRGNLTTSDPDVVLIGEGCGVLPTIYLCPVVENPGEQTSPSGAPITDLQLVADQYPVIWAADQLPDSLTLDVNTGIISGTPTTPGTTTVTVTATNSYGATSDPVVFDWIIT